LEFRLKNLYHDGDMHATGTVIYSLGLDQSVRAVADAIGWESRGQAGTSEADVASPHPNPLPEGEGAKAPRTVRGMGIACSMKAMITPSVAASTPHVHSDGSVSRLSSPVDMGQGAGTQRSPIAAEARGGRVDHASVG